MERNDTEVWGANYCSGLRLKGYYLSDKKSKSTDQNEFLKLTGCQIHARGKILWLNHVGLSDMRGF